MAVCASRKTQAKNQRGGCLEFWYRCVGMGKVESFVAGEMKLESCTVLLDDEKVVGRKVREGRRSKGLLNDRTSSS